MVGRWPWWDGFHDTLAGNPHGAIRNNTRYRLETLWNVRQGPRWSLMQARHQLAVKQSDTWRQKLQERVGKVAKSLQSTIACVCIVTNTRTEVCKDDKVQRRANGTPQSVQG